MAVFLNLPPKLQFSQNQPHFYTTDFVKKSADFVKIAVWRVGSEKRPKQPFPGRFGQKFTSKTPLIIEFYINIGFQKFPKFLFSSFAIRPKFTQTLKLHSSAYARVSRSKPLPGEGPFY